MLTTLLPPTAGTARVAGHDIVREGPAVRAAIGAALQEAALDPLLTGRDHMRLQTTLQGVPKAERRARGDELLERVGLADAADRKVGGYSGGMKRRLDLALALVHRPRVLFLDEPTTGLDPSSRADLWEEVARLARDDGVTVFLTTQYLEEADVLADRVGIIDHGRIVAEGTPEALKARDRAPVGRGGAGRARRPRRGRRACSRRFGAPCPRRRARPRCGSSRGEDLVAVVRALDAADLRVADLQLHQPSLDDVFLAKTGRKLDAAEEEPAAAAGGARGVSLLGQGAEMARRSVLQTLRQPAMVIPPIAVPADPDGGQRRRAATRRRNLPGLPDRQLPRLRDRVPVHPGLAVRVDQRRARASRATSRPGFLNRLALTPMQRAALLLGQPRRA